MWGGVINNFVVFWIVYCISFFVDYFIFIKVFEYNIIFFLV